MQEPLAWQWLGLCTYDDALARQEHAWNACRADGTETCFALEHPATITFGRRATFGDLRVSDAELRARGVARRTTERGGRATFHGPGQLVLYPIVHLARRGLGVDTFVARLEDVMLDVAAAVGVRAGRDTRGRGVWTGRGKLGSVGIRVRHGVSLHGLALNVTADVSGFDLIAPCGMDDVAMTSLAGEGVDVAVSDVVGIAERAVRRAFDPTAASHPREVHA